MLTARNGDTIYIDFSDVEFLYPSGLNTLAVVGQYLMWKKNCKITQTYPKEVQVKNFLVESGFCELVGLNAKTDPNIPPHDGSYIYKIKTFAWPDDFEIEKLIDVIEKELRLSDRVRTDMHENLAELILNVLEHSNSPTHCYVMGQGYGRTHRIRFCIGDAGIGIKNHLAKIHKELLSQDSTIAIEKALQEGITGNPSSNSGVGLSNLKKFVD